MSLVETLRACLREGAFDLPPWGRGQSFERLERLMGWGQRDLSLARLAEGHLDAVTILREAGREPRPGRLYGVWASEAPDASVQIVRRAGDLRLDGTKRFCSGAPLLDAALVTAWDGDVRQLVEVDLGEPSVATTEEWAAAALAATRTGSVTFERMPLAADALVGAPQWYFHRPGFWHGALAPAACWVGGALGLRDAAGSATNAHAKAHRGAIDAHCWGMQAALREGARELDDCRGDEPADAGRRRALRVRHLVDASCREALDRFGRWVGPRLLAFDGPVAQRHADLQLYLRQCHAERDLEALGELSASS